MQIKKLQDELEKVQSNQSQLQMKNKSLKSEIEELEQQLEETEVSKYIRVIYLCIITEPFIYMIFVSFTKLYIKLNAAKSGIKKNMRDF